ncbi:DUF2934 domain-containing protein [Aquibium oceanicum]|uniref:DUF2934 domain-containing protein n=1 Tax=Aquibium oceanicum TaxID=1670800 RepID=UPI0009FA59A2
MVTVEQIRERARKIAQRQGGAPEREKDHWEEAKKELEVEESARRADIMAASYLMHGH